MIITAQNGSKYDIIELEMVGKEIKGKPREVKKSKVLLGIYNSNLRTCEVLSEAWCLNMDDDKATYEMPAI